jgi:hypothetical protein
MSVEAGPESVDFLFNRWDLKILLKDHIGHVPWCVGYHEQDFPLEAFQYFYVGGGSRPLELCSVGPDGFEDDFID